MKKNSGFVLFETLVVSSLILGTLIFMFIQISTIKNSYNVSFKYNTVSGLYSAKILADFLSYDGYDTLKTQVSSSTYGYVDITDCVNSGPLCNKIVDEIDAKVVLFTENDITTLKNNINSTNIDKNLKNFIKRMKNNSIDNNKYRLIIEYNDETCANISVPVDKSTLQKYTLENLVYNSSFEENKTSWTTTGSTNNFTISNNLYKSGNSSATFVTSDNSNNKLGQTINLKTGHKYYASEYIYTNKNISGSATFNFYLNASNNYESDNFNTSIKKKWKKFSSLFTVTAGGNYTFNVLNVSDENTINVDNILLVDLTETFGNGSEPDLDWCNNYIKYFNSTTDIYK